MPETSAAAAEEVTLGIDTAPDDAVRNLALLLPPLAPRRFSWPRRRLQRFSRTAIVASFGIHAAAAYVLVTLPLRDTGAIATPSESVSLELTATQVLEEATSIDSVEASATSSAVAVQAGAEEESAAAAPVTETMEAKTVEEVTVEDEESAEPEGARAITGTAESEDAIGSETVERGEAAHSAQRKPDPAPAKPERQAKKKPDKPQAESSKKNDDKAEERVKGGVVSKGESQKKSSSGRVSASAGNAAGYAARVRARVAANKPSVSGKGTAAVSFSVTKSGGLGYARIARSSGSAALDQAALSAVRRSAPFPPPPPGATTTFTVPFLFR